MHDRALLYFRLLKTNLPQAERIIAGSAQITSDYIEFAPAINDKLMDEFNSLSVIYGQASENFIVQSPPYNVLGMGSAGTGVKVGWGIAGLCGCSVGVVKVESEYLMLHCPALQRGSRWSRQRQRQGRRARVGRLVYAQHDAPAEPNP